MNSFTSFPASHWIIYKHPLVRSLLFENLGRGIWVNFEVKGHFFKIAFARDPSSTLFFVHSLKNIVDYIYFFFSFFTCLQKHTHRVLVVNTKESNPGGNRCVFMQQLYIIMWALGKCWIKVTIIVDLITYSLK